MYINFRCTEIYQFVKYSFGIQDLYARTYTYNEIKIHSNLYMTSYQQWLR